MLYWGDDKDAETCKVCHTSRWKQPNGKNGGDVRCGSKFKKKPSKVLRYFPLKPRLQRLFMSSKTAENMRWHAMDSNRDGLMRHPRDSESWKRFNEVHVEFAADPRNVRLGLAADGFNPFGHQSSTHSTWPVILIPYNLPPWICMKQTSFILSMIIPGKKMPGNDIDIYMQSLIKELNELWSFGIETFDASQGLACPSCNFDFLPNRLPHSRKWCFMGHRRFLGSSHRYRHHNSKFDGTKDLRSPPKMLSGSDVLNQLADINITFGKNLEMTEKGKRSRVRRVEDGDTQQWKKRSIFFQLPYWEFNLLRHNLDVMHIEKNVFDNVLFTLLNDSARSKDNLNARMDLVSMGIRDDLWPNENGKYSPSCFTMTNIEKDVFLATLKSVLLPDGYSSNISRCVDLKNRKIHGLKSHDCHILMEHLLPIAIRNLLPDQVCMVLVELGSFFRQICSRVLNVKELDNLQSRLVLTLCHMEMIFPPSFFTVMVHLVVHLVDEVKLGGPVPYRWMYSIERHLGHLKSFVRNRANPEGSIAEGYIAEESISSNKLVDQ
ncbi:PREDICTED: uncharacterized protein LOC109183788 [Ipomoea nil]|uniref:uncharacterized protein LOC109183788 n=1 Tax=Ipomoea nil TaxID=35883 RepID=UPI000900F89B|nr:PREDICTED: uncharacterized protein LOC109183788 [Ipomoea nil]